MPLRSLLSLAAAVAVLAAGPRPARPCSLCGANFQQAPTWRQEGAQPTARVIVIGVPRDRPGVAAASDLHLTEVLRNDPILAGRKVIELSRYVPNDDKNPTRFLVFCDVFREKLDPFRGIPLKSDAAAEYARKVLKLDPKDTTNNLLFFFRYLESADPEVARDAFLEFAKATDPEIARVAPRLDPARLRSWLQAPRTPPERLSVYALLLGVCGRDEDASFLRKLLDDNSERMAGAYDGALAGFTHLRPRDGWDLALEALRDSRRPLPLRLAVVRMLRFWHGAQPDKTRSNVVRCLRTMLEQGELADLAVEDLRRWRVWDLTRDLLPLYGRKGYDAPIVQQAILRYALTCGDADCKAFVADRRKAEPDAVRDVEEQLRLEK
jgi:hypothetical protein